MTIEERGELEMRKEQKEREVSAAFMQYIAGNKASCRLLPKGSRNTKYFETHLLMTYYANAASQTSSTQYHLRRMSKAIGTFAFGAYS